MESYSSHAVNNEMFRNLSNYYHRVIGKWGFSLSNKVSAPRDILLSEVKADIRDQLSEAIRLKSKVEINYKGKERRIICPHAIYAGSRGKLFLDSHQISGFSNHSDRLPYRRLFDLSKIVELTILDEDCDIAPASQENPNSLQL